MLPPPPFVPAAPTLPPPVAPEPEVPEPEPELVEADPEEPEVPEPEPDDPEPEPELEPDVVALPVLALAPEEPARGRTWVSSGSAGGAMDRCLRARASNVRLLCTASPQVAQPARMAAARACSRSHPGPQHKRGAALQRAGASLSERGPVRAPDVLGAGVAPPLEPPAVLAAGALVAPAAPAA